MLQKHFGFTIIVNGNWKGFHCSLGLNAEFEFLLEFKRGLVSHCISEVRLSLFIGILKGHCSIDNHAVRRDLGGCKLSKLSGRSAVEARRITCALPSRFSHSLRDSHIFSHLGELAGMEINQFRNSLAIFTIFFGMSLAPQMTSLGCSSMATRLYTTNSDKNKLQLFTSFRSRNNATLKKIN